MAVVVPTHERAFYQHVQKAGYVLIDLNIVSVDGKEQHQFSLSTVSTSSSDRHAMLYSRTKPEPKVFISLRGLQATLAKLGFEVAEIPVQAGRWKSFLPDRKTGRDNQRAPNVMTKAQGAAALPEAAVAMTEL